MCLLPHLTSLREFIFVQSVDFLISLASHLGSWPGDTLVGRASWPLPTWRFRIMLTSLGSDGQDQLAISRLGSVALDGCNASMLLTLVETKGSVAPESPKGF